jgi:hypothetical protein
MKDTQANAGKDTQLSQLKNPNGCCRTKLDF